MMRRIVPAILISGIACCVVHADEYLAHAKMRPVPAPQVKLADKFWGPRVEVNRTVTLPHCLAKCEETGRISNFAKAGGLMEGKFEGIYFNDSDVYKILEGAAHVLALHPDEQLEARIDAIIDQIAAAQQDDGYINSYYTLVEPDQRWTNLKDKHELYCAGHMFEAAVRYAEVTGKTKFLDVAIGMADHIDRIFGPGKRDGWPGHEEIELALVKLWRHTGEERYLKLAQFFLEVRGQERDEKAIYWQAHKPVKEQTEIAGHAVRALYLQSGVADVAGALNDEAYFKTMELIWQDVAFRKLYITGGVGARHHGEAFGSAYELPNDTAYAETCAGIAWAMWNHRLLHLHGEARFADMMERELYNAFASSVSLSGDRFFYVNPLSSTGNHRRQPWYGCACCPSNIVRIMPQVPGYVYSQTDEDVWVNLYVQSDATIELNGQSVRLIQRTEYPWNGRVRILVEPERSARFTVHVRVPDWVKSPDIKCQGEAVAVGGARAGYVAIERTWQAGDAIELNYPMSVVRLQAHPAVRTNQAMVALQRGPIVFCLEAVDNNGRVMNIGLPREKFLRAEFMPDLLGGVMVVSGEAEASVPMDWTDKLYQYAAPNRPIEFKAIPYCVWENREPGEMIVWIPEAAPSASKD